MHALIALCLSAALAYAQPGTFQYVKKDTWRATWEASLTAARDGGDVTLGPWYHMGPFDGNGRGGFDAVYPPEKGVDRQASCTGKSGALVKWQRGDAFRDAEVNSLRIYDENDDIAVYLFREITAAHATVYQGSFGSDDGIKAWLNGRLIVSNNTGRACLPDQELAALPLKAGRNELLIKIIQGAGPSGFYFDATPCGFGLGPWRCIGPFDNRGGVGFDKAYAPEEGLDFDRTYTGKDGRELRWQEHPEFADGRSNTLRIFEDSDEMAVYLHRTITSDKAGELPVSLGSDDGIKVWLNGKLLAAESITRACQADQVLVSLPLREGGNDLLVKITQGGGDTGFYFDTRNVSSMAQELAQRLMGDFPGHEMEIAAELDWLRQDNIRDVAGPYRPAVDKALITGSQLLADLRDGRAASFLGDEAAQWASLAAERDALAAAAPDGAGPRWLDLYRRVHTLKRQIALANPLMDFGKLLFVKRAPTSYSHMCDQYYGWYARPGGTLCVLEKPGQSLAFRDVIAGHLPEGSIMTPALSWDGKRILFAYWKQKQETPEDAFYHLWSVNVDGTGLRQLTFGEYDDFSPCFLPDGDIIFISTRRGGYGRCHGRPVPLYTLHRMAPDGAGIVRLSENEANEWDPSVLDDGRIVYARWDYVDRHAVDYQSLWTCWPDGSQPIAIYGNATRNPTALYQPRQIPGTHSVVSTVSAHHSYTAGSLAEVDLWKGVDGPDPIRRLTPEVPFPESEGWPEKYCYATPWPLGENYYLTSFSFAKLESQGNLPPANQHGVYLVDAFGNRELLYRDGAISSMYPLPLRPRVAPPVLASRSTETGEGQFMLMDVYRSLEGIERGTIKALRVIQILPKATPIAEDPPLGMSGQETGKYVLGTVPVAEDGSALFTAPAGKPVFFQALDDRGRAVQSMRTVTYLRPGQTLACVGCHEGRNTTPPVARPRAATQAAARITPGPEGSAPLSYPILVQPIWDKHCQSCHGARRQAADVVLTAEVSGRFTRSYETLMNRPGLVNRWYSYNGEAVTLPGRFGSCASPLARMLEGGHHDVALAADEWDRLYTWIDSNANFYGSFMPADQEQQLAGIRIAPPALQ
jgi:hypothetical protein